MVYTEEFPTGSKQTPETLSDTLVNSSKASGDSVFLYSEHQSINLLEPGEAPDAYIEAIRAAYESEDAAFGGTPASDGNPGPAPIGAPQDDAPMPFAALLMDASTDEVLGKILDGGWVFIGDRDADDLTILVEAEDEAVESMRLRLDEDVEQVEDRLPYALFGDRPGGDVDDRDLEGGRIDVADHNLHLTLFDGTDGTGKVLGQRSLDFAVLDQPPPSPLATPMDTDHAFLM